MSHETAIENYNKGLEYSYQENWDEAVEYLKMAIEEDPTYVNAYNVLGKIYIQKEQIGTARKYWRKALKFDPDNSTSRQCLRASGGISEYIHLNWLLPAILIIFIAGLVITNITMFRRIGELETILASANARTMQGSNGDENAVSNIPESAQIGSPESISKPRITTEYELIEAYDKALKDCLSGNGLQAIESFQRILEYPRPHSLKDNAQYWLAECYYHQRNYLQALSEFEKVKKQYPDSNKLFDAELKTAYTYYKLGRIENARSKIAQLHKNWPSHQYRSKIAALSKEIQDESLLRRNTEERRRTIKEK